MTPFRNKPLRLAALVVRMLLGVFFIVSALAKLVDIDQFEIYIFSYNLLSLNLSFLVARLVICAEVLIGIGLLANIFNRWVDTCAMLMLVLFTLFLGYATLIGRTDSCHCMGPLVEIDPAKSIIKNILLLVALVFAMGAKPWAWRPRWYIWLPVLLVPTVTIFFRSAPDNWLFGPSQEVYNKEELDHANAPGGVLHSLHLSHGKHVVAFLTPGCQFCQMTDEKLTHICQRNNLDSTAFLYFTPSQDSTIAPLTLDTHTFLRPAYQIDLNTYSLITYGQRPILFLMQDGQVVATSHYRNIDEQQIVDFLK